MKTTSYIEKIFSARRRNILVAVQHTYVPSGIARINNNNSYALQIYLPHDIHPHPCSVGHQLPKHSPLHTHS
jgi:hypothetical protein